MRYLHVKAKTQMLVCLGAATFVIWTAISTAFLCIDLLGADNFRQQAKRDADFYHQELSNLKSDRDAKTAQANSALDTFTRAIDYADQLQSQLLEMELQRQEMHSALRILQEKLAATPLAMSPTNAESEQTAIEDKTAADLTPAPGIQSKAAVERLVAILEETTAERDQVLAQSHEIIGQTDELKLELQLTEEKKSAYLSPARRRSDYFGAASGQNVSQCRTKHRDVTRICAAGLFGAGRSGHATHFIHPWRTP
jgi:hypothetical protein